MKSTIKAIVLAFIGISVNLHAATPALPAPLPEFMNQQQLDTWNAQQASSARQTVASAQEAPSQFYTGKPYVADAGGYVYKYRTYSPEMSRWTTADPSGFPDGPNNCFYAPNPSSDVDATGAYTVALIGGGFDTGEQSDGTILFPFYSEFYTTTAGVTVTQDSFDLSGSTSANGSIYIEQYDTTVNTDVSATIVALSNGTIQLDEGSTGKSQEINSGYASSAVAYTYTYLDNNTEVDVEITWGGANTYKGSVGITAGAVGVSSGSPTSAIASGLNNLIFQVEE